MTEEELRVHIEYSLAGLINARTLMIVALAVKTLEPIDPKTLKEFEAIPSDEIRDFISSLDEVVSSGKAYIQEENDTGISFDEPSLEPDDE